MLIQNALATLVLRDIHQPPAPSLWPPAPGWWLLATMLLLAAAAWVWLAARRRKRGRVIAAVFDDALRAASTPADEVAAMSELLRRAARRRDLTADRLQGEAWLEFLDRGEEAGARKKGGPIPSAPRTRGSSDLSSSTSTTLGSRVRGNDEQEEIHRGAKSSRRATRDFSQGPGRLLLEGGYRRDVDPQQVAALKPLARARFLQWMAPK